MLANPFLLGISSVLGPRAAQEYVNHGWTGLRKILFSYGMFIFVSLAVFSVGLLFWGGPLTELFFSEKYSVYFAENFGGTNTITGILGLSMPMLGMSFVFTLGLLAANRPQDSFYAAMIGMTVLMIANFSFAQPTLKTSAISFVVSIGVSTFFRFLMLVRASRAGH